MISPCGGARHFPGHFTSVWGPRATSMECRAGRPQFDGRAGRPIILGAGRPQGAASAPCGHCHALPRHGHGTSRICVGRLGRRQQPQHRARLGASWPQRRSNTRSATRYAAARPGRHGAAATGWNGGSTWWARAQLAASARPSRTCWPAAPGNCRPMPGAEAAAVGSREAGATWAPKAMTPRSDAGRAGAGRAGGLCLPGGPITAAGHHQPFFDFDEAVLWPGCALAGKGLPGAGRLGRAQARCFFRAGDRLAPAAAALVFPRRGGRGPAGRPWSRAARKGRAFLPGPSFLRRLFIWRQEGFGDAGVWGGGVWAASGGPGRATVRQMPLRRPGGRARGPCRTVLRRGAARIVIFPHRGSFFNCLSGRKKFFRIPAVTGGVGGEKRHFPHSVEKTTGPCCCSFW